jgi:hypothetical protein
MRTIRLYEPRDEAQVLTLLHRSSQSEDQTSDESARWLIAGPQRPGPHIVALDHETVVGCLLAIDRCLTVGGATLRAAQLVDGAVASSALGSGVLSGMLGFAFERLPQHYDLLLNELAHPAIKNVLLRKHDARTVKQPIEVLTRHTLQSLRTPPVPVPDGPLQIAETASADVSCEKLAAAAATRFDLLGDRSGAWLHWRYEKAPVPVKLCVAARDGEALGIMAYSVTHDAARVYDLVVHPDSEDLFPVLLSWAIRASDQGTGASVHFGLPASHPHRDALVTLGFLNTKRRLRLQYAPLRATSRDLTVLASGTAPIHWTLGDFLCA